MPRWGFVTNFAARCGKISAKTVLFFILSPRADARGYKYGAPTELFCLGCNSMSGKMPTEPISFLF
jgi:hypothetical protein